MEFNSKDVLFIDKKNTSLIITFGGIKNGIGGHNVVSELKNNNELIKVLDESLL